MARQADAAAQWARQHGYDLDSTHADLGVSGYKGTHRTGGALGRFLGAVEAGRIPKGSALIIEAIDRLSRETPSEAAEMMLRIINAGIRIVTLEDSTEYTRESIAAQQHLMYVLVGKIQQANGFSERLAMRVTHGRREGRAKRIAAGQPITGQCPGWLKVVHDDNGSRYVIISERVKIIEYIFASIAGGMSKQAIAKQLNDRATPSFQTLKAKSPAKGWGTSSIYKLATNRALIGELTPTKTEYVKDAITGKLTTKKLPQTGQTVSNHYPVVIDQLLFDRVNSAQMPRGPKGEAFNNLLQGIPRCIHCFGRMGVRGFYNSREAGRGQRKLVCDNFAKYFKKPDGTPVCRHGGRMNHNIVEEFVIEAAGQLALIEGMQAGDATADMVAKIANNDSEIARTETAITNALDALDGPPSPTILKWIEGKEVVIAKLKADNIALDRKRRAAVATNTMQSYRQLAKLYREAQAEADTQRCAMLRARINTILRATVDALMVDGDDKTVTGWFGGGRLLVTLLDGLVTRYAIMGHRMVRLRPDQNNVEMLTPADIFAQHMAFVGGAEVAEADMPGVFAQVSVSTIPCDPVEIGSHDVVIDLNLPATLPPGVTDVLQTTWPGSVIRNGRVIVREAME